MDGIWWDVGYGVYVLFSYCRFFRGPIFVVEDGDGNVVGATFFLPLWAIGLLHLWFGTQ